MASKNVENIRVNLMPRWLFWWVSVLLVLIVYSFWVEPNWIEVTRHAIRTQATLVKPLKLAVVTDLHVRRLGYREGKILSLLEQEKPDVILVVGDSVAETANYEAVSGVLAQMHAPLGIWVANGNWEHWRPNSQSVAFPPKGVRSLNNAAVQLVDDIWLLGLDDELAGAPDLELALKKVPENAFRIGIFHSPAFFDRSADRINLAFSGHTHGGQVRLPFLPPLWLPEGSGEYISGWYERDQARMYVSRGLGNSILDMRFLSRPELVIVTVEATPVRH